MIETDKLESADLFQTYRKMIDEALLEYLPDCSESSRCLYDAMKYSLLAPSKRFRPILVLATTRCLGKNPEVSLPTACAIEMIHTYSLIHDDLPAIDNDDFRRGIPSAHVAYGEDIAILSGDALFAEAFHLIASKQVCNDPTDKVKIIKEISSAVGPNGMVGGQVVDILSTKKAIDEETLNFIHHNKTGKLITSAVRSGAIIAGASENELDVLTEYSRNLGLSFQITDDILDITGNVSSLGKPVGSDEELMKATFPRIFGLDKSRQMAIKYYRLAVDSLSAIDRDVSELEKLAYSACYRDR